MRGKGVFLVTKLLPGPQHNLFLVAPSFTGSMDVLNGTFHKCDLILLWSQCMHNLHPAFPYGDKHVSLGWLVIDWWGFSSCWSPQPPGLTTASPLFSPYLPARRPSLSGYPVMASQALERGDIMLAFIQLALSWKSFKNIYHLIS